MTRLVGAAAILLLAAPARADFLVVENVDWGPLRDDCRRLLAALEEAGQPLPAETARPLRMLLRAEPKDSEAASRDVQRLLDRHCLLEVRINPESRVKTARGPAAAELTRDVEALLLVKVANDAGVTHALGVHGPGIAAPGKAEAGRWLEVAFAAEKPFDRKLSGRRLDYKVLRLRAREAGKREATFQLDVGQGTQDLGFRAEVPVLFTVR
jgi:hypothetical protein